MDPIDWPAAARSWREAVRADPRCTRVRDLRVEVGPDVVLAHGPDEPLDLFSVTKTVVALLTGVAVERGHLPPVGTLLGDCPGMISLDGPAHLLGEQTLDHLLTLTRGARTDGPFDLDEVEVGTEPAGAVFARSPALEPPGTRFRYDNGATQLLAEALERAVPGGLRVLAEEHLWGPLGIASVHWPAAPGGTPYGPAHLWLRAGELARVGRVLLDGTYAGQRVVDEAWVRAMRTVTTSGGPPEERPYGRGLWQEDADTWFGAGWGGQLLLLRPREGVVVAALADTGFDPGPPARDAMPPDWAAPLDHLRGALGG